MAKILSYYRCEAWPYDTIFADDLLEKVQAKSPQKEEILPLTFLLFFCLECRRHLGSSRVRKSSKTGGPWFSDA